MESFNHITRREFLKYSGAGVVSAVLPAIRIPSSEEFSIQKLHHFSLENASTSSNETKELLSTSVFEVFGIHGPAAADRDISLPGQVVLDAKNAQAKSLLFQQPTTDMLDMANEAGIQVITRIDQPKNIYTPDKLHECLRRHEGRIEQPIYQVGNEVNHEGDNGKKMHGKDYAKTQFMPAALDILRYSNGIVLLPPVSMAPDAKYYRGLNFKFNFLEGIKDHEGYEELISNSHRLADSFHAYIYNPGDDYFQPMREADELNKAMLEGISLPFYVTEAGLGQNEKSPYSEETVAQELSRTLSLRLPEDLQIRSFNWWLLGDDVYRTPAVSQDDQRGRKFNELYALRKSTGYTAAYKAANSFIPENVGAPQDDSSTQKSN